jgi:hypothetical protein
MANRHTNKRLRRAILARMAATGERYQRARAQVLRELELLPALPPAPAADLVEANVNGRQVVLAVIESPGLGGSFVVQRELAAGAGYPHGLRWRRPASA